MSLAGDANIDSNEEDSRQASQRHHDLSSYFNDEEDDTSSPSGGKEVGHETRDSEEVGKDYVKVVDGNVKVRLAYGYDTPPSCGGKGDQQLFLTSITTLVTEKVDILHHARTSLEGKPLALKRSIQASDGFRSYFSKITDLMHRNRLSWYEDDFIIAKDMIDNPEELENDQGRSGLCTCACSPTVTSFMALRSFRIANGPSFQTVVPLPLLNPSFL